MQIQGLFEIHITVGESYYKLWKYVYNKKDFKLIFAVSDKGQHGNQYMISKWKNGSYSQVLNKLNGIVTDMEAQGIKVIRAKIESMAHNEGVPNNMEDYLKLVNSNQLVGQPYFEFHAKLDLMNHSIEDLENWCDDQNSLEVYVAMSTNICGSKMPLVTLRMYKCGRDMAIEKKNLILDNLKDAGYKIIGNIQQEFSIYDTNEFLDKGWLI